MPPSPYSLGQARSGYLALLQFFLNHRKLERSDRAERVGKTPAELLTGQSHPHRLEMLGDTRFVRARNSGLRRIPEDLARQGVETVRTVTQKAPVLNQAHWG